MKPFIQWLICLSLCVIVINESYSQAPQKFNYQAAVRDASGNPITNQIIKMRISIHNNAPSGTVIFQEEHFALANIYGIVNIEIGTGTLILGTISNIDWGLGTKYLEVEIDPSGGTNYTSIGSNQFISVPYALYAESAGNVNDADADPTNEIQALQLNGNDLSISQGNTISLPAGSTYYAGSGIQILNDTIFNNGDLSNSNELQFLQLIGNSLSITGGNSITLPAGGGSTYFAGSGIQILNDTIINKGDLSSNNELQLLQLIGNSLSITGGNSITLPAGGGSTYFAGSGIDISNDSIINTGDLSNMNEIQSLSINGSNLTISGSNTINLPISPPYIAGQGISINGSQISNTGDLNSSNELQQLILSGDTLSISNGNSVVISGGGSNIIAGSGLQFSGDTLINLSPDQVITLNGTGGTSVSGTYPDFTISSAALPTANSGATLRHNGNNWVTNTNGIYNSGSSIGMGTTSPTPGYKLHIEGLPSGIKTVGTNSNFAYLATEGTLDYDGIISLDIDDYDIGVLGVSIGTTNADNYGIYGFSNGWGGIFQNNASNSFVSLGGNANAIRIVDGNEAEGKILVSDDNGNASWRNQTTTWAASSHDMIKLGSNTATYDIAYFTNYVEISSSGGTGVAEIQVAIDVPALMNGKQQQLQSITIEYKLNSSNSFITQTDLYIPVSGDGSFVTAISDPTNRTSTNWTTYSITDSSPNDITGPVLLNLKIYYSGSGSSHAVQIGSIILNIE